MNFQPYELKLAAKLLELAADQFSNHGCNDYNLIEEGKLTTEEAIAVNRQCAEFSGLLEEIGIDNINLPYATTGDDGMMRYLASRLRDEVERS